MTRFIRDQFAKDYLEELLSPYGEVKIPRRVPSEVREIDIWFDPHPQTPSNWQLLGLLGQIAQSPSIIEPFRNAATPDEICDCLLKLLELKSWQKRTAHREKTKLNPEKLPNLWILTPTASNEVLSGFNVKIDDSWSKGIYFLGASLRSAVVVIHQLPKTPETLWIRLLGRGKVQREAIDELEALPADHPYRASSLRVLYSLEKNLEANQPLDEDEKELIMRLAPLYQQDIERAIEQGTQQGIERGIEQGIQQGQRAIVENLLRTRFGELDAQLSEIVDAMLKLPPEEFAPLLLQLSDLSREELLARFYR